MYKKTLLSLAVASSVALTGCFEDAQEDANVNSRAKIKDSQFEGKTWPVFSPATSELPTPNDLIFDREAGDGSFNVGIAPGSEDNPVLNALNNLSGASTVAPAVIQFNGKIDPDTVNSQSFIINPETSQPAPNPEQNVFLLETEYPSEEPVRALSAQEPPTLPVALTAQLAQGAPLSAAEEEAVAELIGADATQANAGAYLGQIATTPRFDHDVVELDGNSALRIRPNQPLDPLKRYVVVVTDEVKDVNGDPISASPAYSKLTEDDGESLGDDLNAIRGLINGFWEKTASKYFGVNNGAREQLGMPPISKDNIALTYSFTTSADEDVLSYIAEPANWIADQVRRSVTTGAAKQAVEGGAGDFTAVRDTVNGALANFTPSDFFNNDGLQPCDEEPYNAGAAGSFEDQFQCVGTLVKLNLQGSGVQFPQPTARSFSFDSSTDAVAQSVLLQNFLPASAPADDDGPDGPTGDVTIHQGSITLPYYLKAPTANDGSPIRTSSWQPDAGLAATISGAAGLPVPQADPDTSSVINYNFPFPDKQKDIEVPLLAITTSDVTAADLQDGGNNYRVAIYQHGITTDRSAALAFGSALVENYEANTGGELVLFAIDQPLHGVAPVSTEERLELAGSLLSSANPALNTEGNRTAVVEGDQQTLQDAGLPASTAAAFISTNSRAGSTIPGIDPVYEQAGVNSEGATERHFGYSANQANQPAAMSFDEANAFGSSGSLFINLTNFLNNRDNLRQGSLDLMNLRATIANLDGVDNNNVYFVGHSLGTLNGGAFAGSVARSGKPSLQLAGTHLITPVAGVTRMLENSPSFAPQILGGLQQSAGLTQGDANLETFLNVNQSTLDSVDPINFASDLKATNIVLSQVNGDRTVINGADARYSGNVETYATDPLSITFPNGFVIDSPAAPLSGSEALATLMDATNTGVGSATPAPAITRYTEGVHATPVLPRAEVAEAGDVLKTREIAQGDETVVTQGNAESFFRELVAQTLQLTTSPADPKEVTGGAVDGSVIQN